MSLQTGLFKTENRFQAIFTAILSLLLSVISIIMFMLLLSLIGIHYDFNEILDFAILSQFNLPQFFTVGLFYIVFLAFVVFIVLLDYKKTKQFKFGNLKKILLVLTTIILFLSLFEANNFTKIIFWSSPLVLTGLSVAIAFRSGLFNIGGQGQMIVGGVFAGIWAAAIVPNTPALKFMDTPVLMIPSMIMISIVFGAIWGGIPGLLRAYTGAHEVITTIMMNQIALNLAFFLVGSPESPFVQKGTTVSGAYGQTEEIINSAKILPIFPEWSQFLNWSIFIVLAVVLIIHLLIWRTNFGYRIRATGFNRTAAEVSGINTKRTIFSTMILAGAVAGLAGGLYVMSVSPYRYIYNQEGSLGFDGIAVSLIGFNNAFPIIIAALLFGVLRQGRINLDLNSNIPSDLIVNLQALVILFTAAPFLSGKLYNTFIKTPNDIIKGKTNLSLKIEELKTWMSYNKRNIISSTLIFGGPLLLFFVIQSLKFDIFRVFSVFSVLLQYSTQVTQVTLLLTIVIVFYILIRYFQDYVKRHPSEQGSVVLNKLLPILLVLLIILAFLSVNFFILLTGIVLVFFTIFEIKQFAGEQRRMGKSLGITVLKLFGLIVLFIHILISFLYILVLFSFSFVDPLVFYLDVLDVLFSSSIVRGMLIAGFPIIMAAIGGTINERAGVINIGLEGVLLISAFGSVYFTFVSGNPYVGIIGGLIAGVLLAGIHAVFTITLKAEHIVTGVGINLLALGFTDLLTSFVWSGGRSDQVEKLPFLNLFPLNSLFRPINSFFDVPTIFQLPILGDLFLILSRQSILFFVGLLIIPLLHILIFKTAFGLRLRVIGEEPNAAATAGISVKKYQYIAVLLSGFVTAIGGVFLAIADSSYFQSNMSGGRGFTALAAMIFGKWTVSGSVLTGLFFGFFYSLAIGLKSFVYFENIFDILTMLPFIIAIMVLAGAIGLARPPKNIGKSYDPQD